MRFLGSPTSTREDGSSPASPSRMKKVDDDFHGLIGTAVNVPFENNNFLLEGEDLEKGRASAQSAPFPSIAVSQQGHNATATATSSKTKEQSSRTLTGSAASLNEEEEKEVAMPTMKAIETANSVVMDQKNNGGEDEKPLFATVQPPSSSATANTNNNSTNETKNSAADSSPTPDQEAPPQNTTSNSNSKMVDTSSSNDCLSMLQPINHNHSGLPSTATTNNDDNHSSSTTTSFSYLADQLRSRFGIGVMVALIMVLGATASAAFLAMGLSSAQREQADQFARHASDLTREIETQFHRYVTAASYVHHFCSRFRSALTRDDFRAVYEYLVADDLDFKAVQFDPNVSRAERPTYEAEARAYYAQNYPHIDYRGFVGFDNGLEHGLVPTGERDFYFPVHFMEPILGNEAAIDLDLYSHISRRHTLMHCMETGEPAMTDRLLLVKDPKAKSRCGSQDAPSYGVVLMHPGVNSTSTTHHPSSNHNATARTEAQVWPRDLSSIVLCVPGLLERATQKHYVQVKVFLHDAQEATEDNDDDDDSSPSHLFLGGVQVHPRSNNKNDDDNNDNNGDLTYLQEMELADIQGDFVYQQELRLTNKVWTVTVTATNATYAPQITFVVLGGTLVLVASICVSVWVYTRTRRTQKFNAMKASIEAEKSALILENTRQAARAERELNDFIAHEVRNPVAAAMAACSFVKSAVHEQEPLVDPQKRTDTREDVLVIYNSLQFINDLLRNMLDMHRASHKQLQVNFETIDLFHDILQSTAGMIYQRDSKVKVLVECDPPNLLVESDCLRLKQVILNLSRNASKFVNEGFIRLRGYVVDNEVRLAVEDSGIGIPEDKKNLLFAKFQESLDQLSQGTVRTIQ